MNEAPQTVLDWLQHFGMTQSPTRIRLDQAPFSFVSNLIHAVNERGRSEKMAMYPLRSEINSGVSIIFSKELRRRHLQLKVFNEVAMNYRASYDDKANVWKLEP